MLAFALITLPIGVTFIALWQAMGGCASAVLAIVGGVLVTLAIGGLFIEAAGYAFGCDDNQFQYCLDSFGEWVRGV